MPGLKDKLWKMIEWAKAHPDDMTTAKQLKMAEVKVQLAGEEKHHPAFVKLKDQVMAYMTETGREFMVGELHLWARERNVHVPVLSAALKSLESDGLVMYDSCPSVSDTRADPSRKQRGEWHRWYSLTADVHQRLVERAEEKAEEIENGVEPKPVERRKPATNRSRSHAYADELNAPKKGVLHPMGGLFALPGPEEGGDHQP